MLRNNSIRYIACRPKFNKNFESLDLSYNKIREIYDMLAYSSRTFINLTHNAIELINIYIPQVTKYYTFPVNKISINDNPIVCDMDLIDFLEYYLNHEEVRATWQLDKLRCARPGLLRGRFVSDLHPSDLLESLANWSKINRLLLVKIIDKCPADCECWVRSASLLVYCASTERESMPLRLPDPRAYKLSHIELYVQHNRIRSLLAPETANSSRYEFVNFLNASHNRIEHCDIGRWLPGLRQLDLRFNNLTTVPTSVVRALNHDAKEPMVRIWMADNPLCCNCTDVPLFRSMAAQRNADNDYLTDACCSSGGPRRDMMCLLLEQSSQLSVQRGLPLVAAAAIACGLLALYYKYRPLVHVWLYARPSGRWLLSRCFATVTDDDDAGKRFDAFVSYSHRDGEFVRNLLVPELERDVEPTFRLCIHERDWLAGSSIVQSVSSVC